jgi:hypothetical protein
MSSATARLSDIEVQKRHSRWGIASTVMGFLSIVLAGALWGLAAYAGNSDNPTVNTIVVTLFIAGGFINLTGLLVGLGSLLQHDRKRLFPIVGLSLNLLVIVSMSVTIAFAIGEGGEVGALIQEGQQLEQDGDYDAAIDAYNNAIDHNPDHGDAYFYRAGAHFQLANNAAAVSDARRATELNPDNAEYQARLCIYGSLLDSVEIEPDILQACERAVELDPDDGVAYNRRGIARALTGDLTGAAKDLAFHKEWLEENHPDETTLIVEREEWITALEAGENPIDEDTLEELREFYRR